MDGISTDVQCANEMINAISQTIVHLRETRSVAQKLTVSPKTEMVTDSLTVADVELEHVQKVLQKIIAQNQSHQQLVEDSGTPLFVDCRPRSRSPVAKGM